MTADAWLRHAAKRFPMFARAAPAQDRIASFVEQGLQGLGNLLASIALARSLDYTGFATIGAMLGLQYVFLGIHRSAIVLPFILDASSAGDTDRSVVNQWFWVNLVSLPLVASLLALVAWLVALSGLAEPWFQSALNLSVLSTPAVLLFEFGRRMLYQLHLPVTAALASACYLAANLALALTLVRLLHSPAAGSLALIGAGLAGGSVALAAVPPGAPSLRAGIARWWRHRGFAFWQTLTCLPYVIYNSALVALVGLFFGSSATATFNAARTLTNPAISIVSAVDSLDKPRAARALAGQGLSGLVRSISHTRRLLALITGGYLAALFVSAPWSVQAVFGAQYEGGAGDIRILCLVFFAMCLSQPSETMLIVLRESRLMLALRIAMAALVLASLQLAQPWGLTGCCLALLGANLVNLAMLKIAEGIASRRWHNAAAARGCGDDAMLANAA